jgi:hypothetical protein
MLLGLAAAQRWTGVPGASEAAAETPRAAEDTAEPPEAPTAPAEEAPPPQPDSVDPPAAQGAPAPVDPTECAPTPLTPRALAQALREGHIRYYGSPPHLDRWACAWAHCAFEQDRGVAIHGNNLGHITARQATGHVCRRRLPERVAKNPDRWKRIDVWFHVFDTPEDGALAYWKLMQASYYSVLARCDDADARGAAERLAAIGYFTGPEEPYIDGMARLFVSARGSLIPRLLASDGHR